MVVDRYVVRIIVSRLWLVKVCLACEAVSIVRWFYLHNNTELDCPLT